MEAVTKDLHSDEFIDALINLIYFRIMLNCAA